MDVLKENIEIGELKPLTGSDILLSRNETVNIEPTFKLHLACNMKLSDIPQSSEPWVRNRVIPSESEYISIDSYNKILKNNPDLSKNNPEIPKNNNPVKSSIHK